MIDKRKALFCIIDVETAGGLQEKQVYDFGYAIVDKKNNFYVKRSFIIQEIFFDNKKMETAYYKEKIPMYHKEISEGKHVVTSWKIAREIFRKDLLKYRPKYMGAYNMAFDIEAMQKTNTLLGYNDKIIPVELKGLKSLCIWGLACETIFLQKSFKKIAHENGWVSEAGNMKTNAEVAYRYIKGNFNFEEKHTGLADVLIEAEILNHCLRQNKKISRGIIKNPWKIPNGKR